jgi:hypothetical protein
MVIELIFDLLSVEMLDQIDIKSDYCRPEITKLLWQNPAIVSCRDVGRSNPHQ